MKIELDRGVDNILFGMTEVEIATILGKPDKVVTTEYCNRDLHYYQQKLVLKIESDNENRLGWIEVHNRQAKWSEINIWDIDRSALLSLLANELQDSYQLDDYGSFESYSFERNEIELQYEFGELTTFNFGVAYDSDDKPIYPEISAKDKS